MDNPEARKQHPGLAHLPSPGLRTQETPVLPAAVALLFFLILTIPFPSFAQVTGPCSNCHTMHYSQNGTVDPEWGSDGPYSKLTVTSCVGCHSATDGATWKDPVTGAPIVYNTQAPAYGAQYNGGPHQGLAGGNFYWVEHADDNRGHNVFENNPDNNIFYPAPDPGGLFTCGVTCCHGDLSSTVTTEWGVGQKGRQGCTKCHMGISPPSPGFGLTAYHHAEQPTMEANGAQGFYRFLSSVHARGIYGLEDPDWQYTSGPGDHNEYYNKYPITVGSIAQSRSIDGYCVGCHRSFWNWGDYGGGEEYRHRHPSNEIIPNDGEYVDALGAAGSGTGTYDPLVPVSRQTPFTGWTAASPTVTLGQDTVTCLTCHRAHGSPYPDSLRWDYDTMITGDPNKVGGCFTCHTRKNDAP